MEKPTLPKGTRDFGPAQMAKRQFIFNTIRKVFENYGFQPLETPAMENLTTLQGKYGDEGDQLLFKVLDSGQFYENFITNGVAPEDLTRFMRGLQSVLRNFSARAFKKFGDRDVKNSGLVQQLIETEELDFSLFGNHIQDPERSLLKKFIKDESVVTAINISQFFIDSQLHNQNFDDQFEIQFNRFVDKVLIKGYSNILNNFLRANLRSKDVVREFSEKGLKYDLTVPFARYVVMNRHELPFPFKRYQMQPVWRADRPQKGRYREFYQCDADVVGTTSLICEAEIIQMIREVFKGLNLEDYTIKINHRGVLSGLATLVAMNEKESEFFVAIDKLDKVSEDKVFDELAEKFDHTDFSNARYILRYKGNTKEKIEYLKKEFENDNEAINAVKEFEEVLSLLKDYGVGEDRIEFDLKLARGLSYYTGCIFEVKINNVAIGSVSGGGRYDNLTAVFDSKEKSSGVGISFGVDRLYDAMEELGAFKEEILVSSKVFICHANEICRRHALSIVKALRDQGIASEVYPDVVKLQKQFDYVNRRKIPFSLTIEPEDIAAAKYSFKNMKTGDQQKLTLTEILSKF